MNTINNEYYLHKLFIYIYYKKDYCKLLILRYLAESSNVSVSSVMFKKHRMRLGHRMIVLIRSR